MPVPIPKPGEKPDGKPGEKPGDKPGEMPKPFPMPGEKPAEMPKLFPKPVKKPGEMPMPIPKPGEKPGEKPAPGQPKVAPHGSRIPLKPGQPRQLIVPLAPRMPEIVKKHFEAKRGFANYYFNKLQQERVWKAWSGRANFAGLGGAWSVATQWEGGGKVVFRLTDADGLLKLRSGEMKWDAGQPLGSSLLPPGSGGLLPTLYLWRRLALEGTQHFGQVEYLGTAPLAGYDHANPGARLADVLLGTCRDVECWFYFDPAQGDLLALEMYPGENVDPCEVYFSGYHDVDGRRLPARMEVRTGDGPFGAFRLEQFTFEKSEKK
jgi:hypothetical protein